MTPYILLGIMTALVAAPVIAGFWLLGRNNRAIKRAKQIIREDAGFGGAWK